MTGTIAVIAARCIIVIARFRNTTAPRSSPERGHAFFHWKLLGRNFPSDKLLAKTFYPG
jgi:hypothetical protein